MCLVLDLAGQSVHGPEMPPASVVAFDLQDPAGVAVDASGAIVVSEGRGTVTRIGSDGGVSILLEGLDGPAGVAFDRDGGLLVVEERAGRIVRRDPGGAVTVIASGIVRPRWLSMASDGTVYVTARAEAILRLSPAGTMTTFADGRRGLEGIAVVQGYLYATLQHLDTDHDASGGAPGWSGFRFDPTARPVRSRY